MAKEQGNIVKSITNLEEQLAGFTQLLEGVAQEVWQELQPSLARVGSLEELVAGVGGDLSSFEKQVEQAEAKVVTGAVLQRVSSVLKNLLLIDQSSSINRCPAPAPQQPSSQWRSSPAAS